MTERLMIKGLVDRGAVVGRTGLAAAAKPRDGAERAAELLAQGLDRARPRHRYVPTDEWDERVRELFGNEDVAGFAAVWEATLADLRRQGLRVGRGAFGGWDDGDVRLGRLAWRLVRNLHPRVVVETGVARGLTSRVILEGLAAGDGGRLWSIDRAPLTDRALASEIGAAVPAELQQQWMLISGSSRRKLPGLVRKLGCVDLFVHDSMHTTRNLRFELECVWPALRPGGAALIDDVERNRATGDFLRLHGDAEGIICPAEDGAALIAVVRKRS